MNYAIIGGTGVYDPGLLENTAHRVIGTPYGEVNVEVGTYQEREIVFLARHGSDHSVAPHRINYRANIWALKALGVKHIIATNAVGSVNRTMRPGDLVILDQFLDFTKARESTFFDGDRSDVTHIDVTDPYCNTLRKFLISQGEKLGLNVHARGCYACFEGPRYETAAEVQMTSILGGDVVGMTNVPEVVLAREAGICYGTICMVTNMGAGISENPLTHTEVVELMSKNIASVRDLALQTIAALPLDSRCLCNVNHVSLPGMQES